MVISFIEKVKNIDLKIVILILLKNIKFLI
jgi:hypothetical protein